MPNVLIVDDDPSSLDLLTHLFEGRGYTASTARSLAEARNNLDSRPDLCVVDLLLPDGKGTDLLDEGLGQQSDVVVLTGHASVESSVLAFRKGARDYLTKPLARDDFDRLFPHAMPAQATRPASTSAPVIIGESPVMQRVLGMLGRIGHSGATVLIIGESGTGKELIAAQLHRLSPRASGPYLALNCGAVSPNLIESELFGHEKGSFTGAHRQHAGYFERAHGGTLFLDEITEMPVDLQVRLLRVLESRRVVRVGSSESLPVDVRVIAATNRDPAEAVREGKLREDLLYRLQVVPIAVPPLRMRTGDVRLLALHFLAQLNKSEQTAKTFSESALAQLEEHSWPGNVRELFNTVQRAFILTEGREITRPALPREIDATLVGNSPITVRFGDSLADVEQRLILHTVRNCRTQDEAARMLGVSTKTVYNKLRLYESLSRARRQAASPTNTSEPAESAWHAEEPSQSVG